MNSGSSLGRLIWSPAFLLWFFPNCLLHPQHRLSDISIDQLCIVWKHFTFSFCVACEFRVLQQCLFELPFVILSNLVNTLIFHEDSMSHVRVLVCLDTASMKTVIGLDAVSFSSCLGFFFPYYSISILGGSRAEIKWCTACFLRCSARPLILHKWARE